MPAFTLEGFESPEEVQARIGKAKETAFRPQGNINQMIYQTAAQGAAGLGGAVAGALGYEDPQVKKSREIQEMMKDLDPTTSAGLYEGADRLRKAGEIAAATAIDNKALEMRKVEAAEAPTKGKAKRFKGLLNGENVIAFSDGTDTYARTKEGNLIKNPKGLTEVVTGTTEFDTGSQKKSITNLEEVIINNESQVDSIASLRETYRPDSLTYSGQLDMFALKQMEKAGQQLTPEQSKLLGDHSVMQAENKANLAAYIKQQSGVAASDKERKFLSATMPNADDSASTYMAKLDRLETYTKNNLARSRWLLRNGLMKKGRGTREEYEQAARKAPPLKAFEDVRKFNEMLRSGKMKNPTKEKARMKAYLLKNKWKIKVGS